MKPFIFTLATLFASLIAYYPYWGGGSLNSVGGEGSGPSCSASWALGTCSIVCPDNCGGCSCTSFLSGCSCSCFGCGTSDPQASIIEVNVLPDEVLEQIKGVLKGSSSVVAVPMIQKINELQQLAATGNPEVVLEKMQEIDELAKKLDQNTLDKIVSTVNPQDLGD